MLWTVSAHLAAWSHFNLASKCRRWDHYSVVFLRIFTAASHIFWAATFFWEFSLSLLWLLHNDGNTSFINCFIDKESRALFSIYSCYFIWGNLFMRHLISSEVKKKQTNTNYSSKSFDIWNRNMYTQTFSLISQRW